MAENYLLSLPELIQEIERQKEYLTKATDQYLANIQGLYFDWGFDYWYSGRNMESELCTDMEKLIKAELKRRYDHPF